MVTNPHDMSRCAQAFYSSLYQAENIDHTALHELLTSIPSNVCLDDDDGQLLLEPWSEDEIVNGLSRSPHHSSPGIDGFPYELLKFLYHHPQVKRLLKQVFDEALVHHKTPASWRKAVVTLLPKKGDGTLLRNWRPISLICTDAKVFTRMLTTRLSPLMQKLINPYQTGFLHDRFIADNGLLARLVMSLAQKYKLPGAALLLDQEKAYDRVHPEYLQAVLHRFGFPTPLINSIIHLFFNTQLCINVNGYISSPCHQQRGLRPGDPLSPLLFNLMLEPLLRSILSTPAIQGFSFDIPGSPMHRNQFATTLPPLKTLAYADDVLIFVTDKDEVQEIMTIIQLYCRASNAKLNCHKTLAVSLNGHIPDDWKQAFASHDLIHWHDRSCNEAATYLCFPLNSTADQLDQFLQLLLEKVKAHVNILKSRSLSIRGKALTANSLILSRLWYCLRILPSTQQFLNQITSIIIQYLQGKTLPKVSFMTCCRPKTEGGLGILHPIHHLLSLQLRWILPLISLHHAYPDSSLADPYLRVCIQSFCNTLSPVIPILFPERRLNSISSFGHFKTLFEACDKLQVQVNWNQATHHTVLEFPLTSIDTFTGDATEAPSPTWHSLLATAPNGLWRINTFFLSLLDTGPSTPIPLNITSDYCNLGSPITRSGLTVDNFKRKEFRYSLLTPFHALPSDYPRAPPGAWHRFWNSALIPHRATTVIWRLVHHRISSRERLHRIIPAICQSNACLLCAGNVDAVIDTTETDKHFFYACPHVQEVWRVLATRFSLSSLVQWDHISTLSRTPPKPTADTRITGTTIIACGVLAIWKAHWQFIYNDERFQAQAVANKAAATIHQIEQECNLIARDV
ncbi:hypothetical protein RO3G_01429 [Lichtheimia corymbifera JMRC:FSU:9682]|uniref:Reverse transcriptase domain-containing protein n=1 Tax=Lichtheimia corymbifera JMRC:FSU:9682 TaxID=1263082 RepID=A0A068SG21_9FUNG|nr:hypothetical protein RO3G_01429 [Lichtheimia corymbifera JMRC:FSU:9682]